MMDCDRPEKGLYCSKATHNNVLVSQAPCINNGLFKMIKK
uniref:Uncharacterized protein n=1 Tax=Anguilla anguilla TaxID=7936 RepID=A0A0E9PN01_ANGAN